MAYKNSNPLRPICRLCEYRRLMAYKGYATNTNFLHACCYILIEDEPRGCTPTDDYCEKFKPRSTKTKSLTGRREIIK